MKAVIPVSPENIPSKASPFRPFKTHLKLLQFFGWPLKICYEEATEVRKRSCFIIILICFVVAVVTLLAMVTVGLTSKSVDGLNEIFMENQNIKSWERISLYGLTFPSILLAPVLLYHLYNGVAHKMNAFLKEYAEVAETLQGSVKIICIH